MVYSWTPQSRHRPGITRAGCSGPIPVSFRVPLGITLHYLSRPSTSRLDLPLHISKYTHKPLFNFQLFLILQFEPKLVFLHLCNLKVRNGCSTGLRSSLRTTLGYSETAIETESTYVQPRLCLSQ